MRRIDALNRFVGSCDESGLKLRRWIVGVIREEEATAILGMEHADRNCDEHMVRSFRLDGIGRTS